MSGLAREVEVAIAAAKSAAAAVMQVYATDFSVEHKDGVGGDDPVTAADREANALIVEALSAAFPEDGIVAEESPLPVDSARKGRCWFVDPLDGTKEFVARNGEFCVMIGLAIDGVASVGVLAIPALDARQIVLVGVVGEGAWLDDAEDSHARAPLVIADLDAATHARIVVSRSRPSPAQAVFAKRIGSPTMIPCGSVGVKVAHLLLGRADAYLHPPARPGSSGGAKLWDTCAPEALVRAAGGLLTDGQGRALDYAGAELVHRHGLVAAGPKLHGALLALFN